MSALRTLKRLVLGDTWVLPVGVALVLVLGGLVVRPLLTDATWSSVGGFVLLTGVLVVLGLAVRRSL